MADWINILPESTIWLGLFYCVYRLFLRKIKWLEFNRIFLLAGLLIAVVLPWLQMDWWNSAPKPFIINVGKAIQNSSQTVLSRYVTDSSTSSSEFNWLIFFYFMVSVVLLLHLIFTVAKIQLYRRYPEKVPANVYAFSFFNFVYLNPSITKNPNNHLIHCHEKAHARQLHSIDVSLLYLIRAFYWANPFTWIYIKAMRENHEYMADESVLQLNPRKLEEYQQQMLSIQLGVISAPVNNFNLLPIKKRIAMMNKKEINTRGKVFLLMISILFICSIVACKGLMENVEPEPFVFMTDSFDKETKNEEGLQKLNHQLMRKMKYPAIARKNQVEGEYFVTFVIDEKGTISHVDCKKEQTYEKTLARIVVVGYGKQKLENVPDFGIEGLQTNNPPIIPVEKFDKEVGEEALIVAIKDAFYQSGYIRKFAKNGKPVKVKFELPILFKLG